jgi:hypothetical protein
VSVILHALGWGILAALVAGLVVMLITGGGIWRP